MSVCPMPGPPDTPRTLTDRVPTSVTVLVENSYECGRQSSSQVQVPAPVLGRDIEDWWSENVPTGDGHPCGAAEHALYEVRIIAAPDRPELVGLSTTSEG